MNFTMNQKQYAAHRGVAGSTVFKAIQAGRLHKSITYSANGKPRIDPDLADREWAANTDPGIGGDYRKRNIAPPAGGFTDASHDSIETSRQKKEAYRAERERLALIKEQARLVDVGAIEIELQKLAHLTRDTVIKIPDRIAEEIAAESDPHRVHVRLTEEFRSALIELCERIRVSN